MTVNDFYTNAINRFYSTAPISTDKTESYGNDKYRIMTDAKSGKVELWLTCYATCLLHIVKIYNKVIFIKLNNGGWSTAMTTKRLKIIIDMIKPFTEGKDMLKLVRQHGSMEIEIKSSVEVEIKYD